AYARIERRERAGESTPCRGAHADVARSNRQRRAAARVQGPLEDRPAVLLDIRACDRRHDVAGPERLLSQRHDARRRRPEEVVGIADLWGPGVGARLAEDVTVAPVVELPVHRVEKRSAL